MKGHSFIYLTSEELREVIRTEMTAIIREEIKKIYDLGQNDSDVFFDITQASEFIGLSCHTLRRMAQNREIPAIKKPNKWMFQKSELEKYMMQGKRKTREEIVNETKVLIEKKINNYE